MVLRLTARLICIFALLAGSASAAKPPKEKLKQVERVLSHIDQHYVESIDNNKLLYGALRGMVETLDPHSAFLTPDEYRELKQETQGEFGGIGIEVELQGTVNHSESSRALTVVSVIKGTPAEKAGLQPGDKILEIDGVATQSIKMDSAIHKMRGPKGSKVTLLMERRAPELEKKTMTWSVTLDRREIHIVPVEAKMLEPGVGYIYLRQFTDSTAQEFHHALGQLSKASPGEKMSGLIVDLRNNPGGLLDAAVQVTDEFLKNGLIVRTEGKAGEVEQEWARSKGKFEDVPLVILVNGGSASAAEIVAAALQDHKRAVIIGTQTFGKGSVQTIIEFDDGSALKLTVARYYAPSGRSIQARGIEPDIWVDQLSLRDLDALKAPATLTRERDLEGHLANLQNSPGADSVRRKLVYTQIGDDYQLRSAYDHLKTWLLLTNRTNQDESQIRQATKPVERY